MAEARSESLLLGLMKSRETKQALLSNCFINSIEYIFRKFSHTSNSHFTCKRVGKVAQERKSYQTVGFAATLNGRRIPVIEPRLIFLGIGIFRSLVHCFKYE
jgi:hypothetical protein